MTAGADVRTPTPRPYGRSMPTASRRAPRYRRFVGTGVVLGLVAAVALARAAEVDARYTWVDVFRYLAVVGALVGGLAGGAVAVWLDRPHGGAPSRPRRANRGSGG